jgi:hypothetical protein
MKIRPASFLSLLGAAGLMVAATSQATTPGGELPASAPQGVMLPTK